MATQTAYEPSSRTFISQRLRLHYSDWGNEGAPPLILLHGGRDHGRSWDWVAERLRPDFHIIAPDLRGHGDSEWSASGDYSMHAFVCDLAELIRQQGLAPLCIVAHSLGGNIALRYTGLYPENVVKLVAIEGLGPSPTLLAERARIPIEDRLKAWIDGERQLAERKRRNYESIEAGVERMQEANLRLTPAQALHLTRHGIARNEDGSYSWKFDEYVRAWSPVDLSPDEVQNLWARITCPTLLVYGGESWASNPAEDGRLSHFSTARVSLYPEAAHWVHHDQLDAFVAETKAFLLTGA